MRRLLFSALASGLIFAALFPISSAQGFGIPVQCGDVITQDTKLDSDLTNCPGDGIVIGADDIELDLNGHTIDGVQTRGCEEPFAEANGVSNPDVHDGVT